MSENADSSGAWLGLLKWSLSYVDGTVPSEESPQFKEMSAEDKAFLEDVMKNGIIDEGERLKTILSEMVAYLESLLNQNPKSSSTESTPPTATPTTTASEKSVEDVIVLLEELQDIVEQIDFAKSFAAMGGIQFLVGCASKGDIVPQPIRSSCLAILATLCQNNPAVQYMMLDQGNIPKLIQLYFDQITSEADSNNDTLRMRTMQAMSSTIRNHDMAEKIFCMNSEGIKMIESGLGLYSDEDVVGEANTHPTSPLSLRRRTLFFVQALVTSDSADADRIKLFKACVQYIVQKYVDPEMESNAELREMALSMLHRLLDQKKCINAILDFKQNLVGLGVNRVSVLRSLEGEEREYAAEELYLWELMIVELARAQRDENREAPLLLGPSTGETLPQ